MAQLTSRNKVFADLDLDFDVHPNTKQLNILSGDAAIVRSLKNLVMTSHYERLFHPEVGCNVKNSLFENIMASTAITLKNDLMEVIENYEPRLKLISVDVIAVSEQNGYNVTIKFFVVNQADARQITFFLERVR